MLLRRRWRHSPARPPAASPTVDLKAVAAVKVMAVAGALVSLLEMVVREELLLVELRILMWRIEKMVVLVVVHLLMLVVLLAEVEITIMKLVVQLVDTVDNLHKEQ